MSKNFFVTWILGLSCCFAQADRGALTGTITDATHAGVCRRAAAPFASISIRRSMRHCVLSKKSSGTSMRSDTRRPRTRTKGPFTKWKFESRNLGSKSASAAAILVEGSSDEAVRAANPLLPTSERTFCRRDRRGPCVLAARRPGVRAM